LALPVSRDAWIEPRFAIQAGESCRRVSIWLPEPSAEAGPDDNWPQPCIEQLVPSCVE
jgi:hypothetical protein